MFTMMKLPAQAPSLLLLCVFFVTFLTSSSHAFSVSNENGGASASARASASASASVRRSAAVKTSSASSATTCWSSSSSAAAATTTRKAFFQDLVGTAVTVATTSSLVLTTRPQAANADITSKVASSTALRNVKTSQKRLQALNEYAKENEYMKVKEALREAPLSEVRKSCTTLVNGGEDGPDAEKLQTKYKTFIGALEKMDSTGSVALRGKKLKEGQFERLYQETLESLADFLVTAEEAVLIPMQYPEEAVAIGSS